MIVKILKKQPYLLLLFTSLFFFSMIFVKQGADSTFDINVHDTYFVVEHAFLAEIIAVFLFILFFLYWVFDKIEIGLFSILSKIHVYGTIVSLLGITFPYYLFYDDSPMQGNDFFDVNFIIALFGLLFLLVHLVFVLNIILGVFNKMKNLAT